MVSKLRTVVAVSRPISARRPRLRSPVWLTVTPLRAELLVAAALLAALGAAVFGSHVIHGGFYLEDWQYLDTYRYRDQPGVWGALQAFSWLDWRPTEIVYLPALYGILGLNTSLYLAWSVLLTVVMALLVYVLLRTLGMERLHAGLIACLVLLFPASDSTRLWTNGSLSTLGIDFYLVGVLLALRGLREAGRRAAAWHAAAVLAYVVSICTYEVTAGPIVIGGLLYAWRAGWRPALPRWIVDAIAAAATLLLITSRTWYETQSLAAQFRHARDIADQSLHVLKATAVPFGSPSRPSVLAPLVAVALGGLLVARLLPAADPDRWALRRWILTGVAAVIAIGAGYLMFVPAALEYEPLTPGIGNRMNNLASVGYVLLIYSLVMLAVTLLLRGLPRAREWSAGLAVLASAVLAVGWIGRIDRDKTLWDRAADVQSWVVADIQRALPDPPRQAVIYVGGHPTESAPGIPVFWSGFPFDIDGAVKAAYDDGTLSTYPLIPGSRFACGDRAIAARNANNRFGAQAGPYGRAFVVFFSDVGAGRALAIDDRRACRAAGARLERL